MKNKYEAQSKQIAKLIKSLIKDDGTNDNKQLDKYHKILNTTTKRGKKIIDRLTPIIQIWRLVAWLGSSVFCLLVDAIVRNNVLGLYNHWAACTLLVLSVSGFIGGIIVLKQIVWTLMEARLEFEKSKFEKPLESGSTAE
jgi:hypothetical protein